MGKEYASKALNHKASELALHSNLTLSSSSLSSPESYTKTTNLLLFSVYKWEYTTLVRKWKALWMGKPESRQASINSNKILFLIKWDSQNRDVMARI